ncbi:salivary peroxidase/catechol oxidase-like [Babylonia areolata]|uniref:salivary peroxidase/catechol oxidase-like n=1 Tax=Babylonia areolata TaxID=304850 RepID=UPI003FCFE06D
MYDAEVCAALRLTGQTLCQGPQGWTSQCHSVHCLMNMMCFPFYNFACYFSSMGSGTSGSGGTIVSVVNSAGSKPQANQREPIGIIQNNCFELPELADGELTGLIDDKDSELRQCPHENVEPECQDKLRYRTIDGSCNNLQNPRWGKAFEAQKRLLSSQLEKDGFPRSRAKGGNSLPPARAISRAVSPMLDVFADVTNMVMAWGQFIDHDFTGTPVIKNGTQKIKCCGDIDEALKVENGDCMQFVRSLAYSFPNGTRMGRMMSCLSPEPREQINTLTSFLDASAVYGNSQDVLDKIRGQQGTMKVTEKNMLPENPSGTCKKEKEGDYCLLAGDHRVNVFVGLGALHTTFVREHNRLAAAFRGLNPAWDDETVFQEARRVVSAEFQRVTYAEWLPVVLDDVTMSDFRLREGDFRYDSRVNPTVSNVFSTAAFRFGHSQVKQKVKIGEQSLELQDTLMRPGFTFRNMTDVLRGIVAAPTDDVDNFFATGLTNHMFETNRTAMDGLDLVAVNIQRGRDHGLPPFNDWREFCNLPRVNDFASLDMNVNLGNVYEDVDDVDVFVGLMVEKHKPGSLTGPTLACLLGHQFRDMKLGDRFFYEADSSEGGFSDDQLREIKKVTLARILCDNNLDLGKIQANVFKMEDPERSRPLIPPGPACASGRQLPDV